MAYSDKTNRVFLGLLPMSFYFYYATKQQKGVRAKRGTECKLVGDLIIFNQRLLGKKATQT